MANSKEKEKNTQQQNNFRNIDSDKYKEDSEKSLASMKKTQSKTIKDRKTALAAKGTLAK